MRLGIAGSAVRIAPAMKKLRFNYGPKGRDEQDSYLVTELADGRKSYLLRHGSLTEAFTPPQPTAEDDPQVYDFATNEELAAAREIDSLTLNARLGTALTVNLGPMERPIGALQGCVAELMKEWKLDTDRLAHASRLPKPRSNPAKWMDSDDYPKEMLAKDRQEIVGFRLIVDETGKVEDCHVDVDKPGPFEGAVCKGISKRASFEPTLDADGKPIRSLYANSVRFNLFG